MCRRLDEKKGRPDAQRIMFFQRASSASPSGQARETRIPESLVCNLVWNFVQTTFTKKAISRVLGLRFEQTLWRWKANSNIYKFMFHEVQLIPMFVRSKRAIKRSQQNNSSAISSGRDCRRACVKNTFWSFFWCPIQTALFPFGRRVLVTVLNELKLLPRSRDDGAIINTPL